MGGADAKELGLEIEIKLVDAPTAVNTWVSGDYDLGSWGYAYNIDDPDDYVTAIYGPGSRNFTRWQNPAFLKLLDQQRSELDRDKRQQTLRQMEKFLLTPEEPYVPLFWARRSYRGERQSAHRSGAFPACKHGAGDAEMGTCLDREIRRSRFEVQRSTFIARIFDR